MTRRTIAGERTEQRPEPGRAGRGTRRYFLLSAALLTASGIVPRSAHADPKASKAPVSPASPAPASDGADGDAKATAREAARRGNEAFAAGRYGEALESFRDAEKLVHAPTHLLMIARTELALGHLAAADDAYRRAAGEKLSDAAPDAFRRAQHDAAAELAALAPRVPRVMVSVSKPDAPELVVLEDGKPLDRSAIGAARAIDPGEHVFEAKAAGLRARPMKLAISERQQLDVVLDLAPVSPAPAGATPGAPPARSSAAPAAPVEPVPDTGPSPLRMASVSAFVVGVAGLAVGAAFTGLAGSKRAEADEAAAACHGCSPTRQREIDALDRSATGMRTVSTVGFVAGGTFVAGGLALLIASAALDERAEARPAPHTTAWVGPGSVHVSGSF